MKNKEKARREEKEKNKASQRSQKFAWSACKDRDIETTF